ncbi:MAG: phycobilisome linker polypeptide [Coleofasciculaceae cyanobacterium]
MLGSVLGGRSGGAPSASRYFRYEVAGLSQSEETENMDYQIRSSANVFITVPYNRMNQEMQRITRMGGKIVNIEPVTADSDSHESHDSHE